MLEVLSFKPSKSFFITPNFATATLYAALSASPRPPTKLLKDCAGARRYGITVLRAGSWSIVDMPEGGGGGWAEGGSNEISWFSVGRVTRLRVFSAAGDGSGSQLAVIMADRRLSAAI